MSALDRGAVVLPQAMGTPWWDVLRFELAYQCRRPAFWLVSLLFAAIGAVDVWSNAGQGRAFFFINSPSQILQTTVWYTLFSVLAATAFVGEAFVRDARCNIESLILATPVHRSLYVGARFVAAWLAAVLAFSACVPAMLLATQLPGLNAYAIGPVRWEAYLAAYVGVVLPNLFLVSVFAFVLTSRVRRLMVAYVGAVVLVMLYVGAMIMVGLESLDADALAWWTWLDPYGRFALEAQSLSWSIHEHNTRMPDLSGAFLSNRAAWLVVGALAWWWAYRTFDMRPSAAGSSAGWRLWRGRRQADGPVAPVGAAASPAKAPSVPQAQVPGWWALPALVRFEFGVVWRSASFRVLLLVAGVTLCLAASGSKSFEHSNPSTDILVFAASQYLRYVLTAVVIFYAAELSWRERDAGLAGVVDAMPLPDWLRVLSKLMTLVLIVAANLLLCMLVLAGYQLARGYTEFEWGLSATLLFGVHGPHFVFLGALALFMQALCRQRYAGMALTLLVVLSIVPLDALGLYHNLYRFGQTNDIGYSPMNGFGGLFEGHLWFVAYWSCVSALLLALACLLWPRGTVGLRDTWARSWALIRKGGGQGRTWRWVLGAVMLMGGGVAGWIIYNTTVLNPYQPPGKDLLAVNHERLFKRFEGLPMPQVVSTHVRVDMDPEARAFVARGEYLLENRGQVPIDQIHLSTFINLRLDEVDVPGGTLAQSWPQWGYHIYRLAQPLQPGARTTLRFATRNDAPRGFQNHVDSDDVYMVPPNEVLHNGTSLYSPFILPFIGYTKMVEHKEAWLRDKYGLPPLDQRMRPHGDPVGLSRAMQLAHLGWGETDVIASTSGDQTIVSGGQELRRWQEGGRNLVHYRSSVSDRGKFTLYSARFDKARHEGARVPIEVYRHPAHGANEAAMARHLGQAFSLYEGLFGPYPFGQIRLAEFAYYPGMVFSDGGVIGLPEVLGWKVEPGDPAGQDALVGWLSYLLAHAWWEGQIIVGDVAGAMTVREMASGHASNLYRATIHDAERLRVLRRQQMRDYFRAVGKVDYAEPPLTDVYNEVLVARFKGAMVLGFLSAQLGPEAVNGALRGFIDEHRGKGPPYATVLGLRDALVARAPAVSRDGVRELFDEVVTFGLVCREARGAAGGGGMASMLIDSERRLGRGLARVESAPLGWSLPLAVVDAQGAELARHVLPAARIKGGHSWEIPVPAGAHAVVLDPDVVFPVADRSGMRCVLR